MSDNESTKAKGDILVVDDDLPGMCTLSEMLTAEGYNVRCTPNGPTALTQVDNAPPDLVLIDIHMAGMDDNELCRKLKADEEYRDIPILFLRSLDGVSTNAQTFGAGAADFITKPFQGAEVLARVRTHLELSRLRRQVERLVDQRPTRDGSAARGHLWTRARNSFRSIHRCKGAWRRTGVQRR